jgi:hypothetical protein
MTIGALQCEAFWTRRVPSTCPSGTTSGCIARRLRRQQSSLKRSHLSTRATSSSPPTIDPAYEKENLSREIFKSINPALAPTQPREPWRLHRALTNPWAPPLVAESQDSRREPDILRALRRGDPDTALQTLLKLSIPGISTANEVTVVQKIPRTTFHELLRLVDPDYALGPFKSLLRDMKPLWIKQTNIHSIEGILSRYMKALDLLFKIRRKIDKAPSSFEYTFLLKCASAIGDGHSADFIWDYMLERGNVPDLECYNHLLGSLIGFGGFQADQRHSLSVGSYNLLQKARRPDSYSGRHRGGIRERMVALENNMKSQGLVPNLETLSWKILGLARVGDVGGISSILWEAWSINVGGIDEVLGHQQGPQSIGKSSPIYPTEDLLCTVAEAYGTCNNIPTAMRAIDLFSQVYSVQVTPKVWSQLLTSTYILSRQNAKSRDPGAAGFPGKLPRSSVSRLWNTMIEPPYNINPTMPMRSRHVKALMLNGHGEMVRMEMERGRLAAIQSGSAALEAENKCLRALEIYPSDSVVPPSVPSLEQLRKELHLSQIIARRDKLMIYTWIRLLFFGSHWRKPLQPPRSDAYNWKYRQIPNIVAYWWEYLPQTIWYSTKTGQIAFEVDNAASKRRQERGWEFLYRREEDGGPNTIQWSKSDSAIQENGIRSEHSDELDMNWLQDGDPFTPEDDIRNRSGPENY